MDLATVIELKPELRIENVEALKGELAEALAAGPEAITLEAGATTGCDTATLQLLVALVREAEQAEITVHWKNASESIVAAAGTLALSQALGLAEVEKEEG